MSKCKKLFIFDLDGTLADAYQAIEKSLNFTRKKLGCSKVRYVEVKRKVGHGDRHFIATFFPNKDVDIALAIYRKHHKQSLKVYSKALPYAKKILDILQRNNKIVAIASNRPRYFTDIIIKALGFKKYLNYIICADEINSLKPKPKILNLIIKKAKVAKTEAVYIGDMAIDMETAHRAKIDAIFVKGGSSSIAEVTKYKNKKVIFSLREITKLYN